MSQIISLLVLCVLLLSGLGVTMAQTDEREMYDQQQLKLKRDNPAEYEKQRRFFVLATQTLLGRLGYDVGPFDGVLGDRAQAALKLYQRNRGLPITGDPLSFKTAEQVSADFVALDQQTVNLPRLAIDIDAWDDGYVSAEGTWALQGEEQAWPEQTSRIRCLRNHGICLETTAIVESSLFGTAERSLSVDLVIYQIERWDNVELVTKPYRGAYCVQQVRRISRIQKSVTGIRSTVSTDDLCQGMAEKYLVLVDGLELSQELQKKQSETWLSLMQISPGIRKMMQQ